MKKGKNIKSSLAVSATQLQCRCYQSNSIIKSLQLQIIKRFEFNSPFFFFQFQNVTARKTGKYLLTLAPQKKNEDTKKQMILKK